MDFVEIFNVCARKAIIEPAKRIINSDKMCCSYSDLNFGVTFLEHSVEMLKRELVSTECLIIKMCFKFLCKTARVCGHLKFIWETVPLCWTALKRHIDHVLYAV